MPQTCRDLQRTQLSPQICQRILPGGSALFSRWSFSPVILSSILSPCLFWSYKCSRLPQSAAACDLAVQQWEAACTVTPCMDTFVMELLYLSSMLFSSMSTWFRINADCMGNKIDDGIQTAYRLLNCIASPGTNRQVHSKALSLGVKRGQTELVIALKTMHYALLWIWMELVYAL